MRKTTVSPLLRFGLLPLILAGLVVAHPIALEARPSEEGPESEFPDLDDSAQLADYLAYAALANPGLEAAFNRWQASIEKIDQVGALPDPIVSYAFFISEVETRVGPQEQKLGVAQVFPWWSKLRLREAVASEAANAVEQHYQATKLRLFFAVKDSYHELYYLARAIAISEDNIALLKHLESVAQANFMVGAPVSGVIKAQVELGKVDDRLRTLEALRKPIVARLNAALGRASDAPVAWPQEMPVREIELDEDAVLAALPGHSPELRRLDFEVAREEQAIELARQEFRPNFVVGLDWVDTSSALASGVPGSGRDPVVAKVSVSVPIWRSKYRAGVREAERRREAIQGRRDDVENSLEAGVKLALFRFHDAERKIDLFRDTLVPLAEASLEVAQVGYEAGKEDFLSVIDAQRLLLDFQLSFERAVADREQRMAELEMLIGRPLGKPRATDPAPTTGVRR